MNKTKELFRLKNFVSNQPLEDSYHEGKLQSNEKVIIPQDDLYTITGEADFGDQLETLGNVANPIYLPSVEQSVTSNDEPCDADEIKMDY